MIRRASSGLAVGLLATTLVGCASSGKPASNAAAGEPSSAAARSTVPASTSAVTSSTTAPAPAPTSAAGHPTPTAKTSPTPTAHRSTSPSSKPKTTSSAATATKTAVPPATAPTSFGYDPAANSKAQIDAARAAAKADGRAVLLDFGASWCGNCVAMDAALRTVAVKAELASAYHLVQIDADDHMDLVSQYAPTKSGSYGLPVLVILSPSGTTRVDTDKSGNPDFDAASFLAFLKKWAG